MSLLSSLQLKFLLYKLIFGASSDLMQPFTVFRRLAIPNTFTSVVSPPQHQSHVWSSLGQTCKLYQVDVACLITTLAKVIDAFFYSKKLISSLIAQLLSSSSRGVIFQHNSYISIGMKDSIL